MYLITPRKLAQASAERFVCRTSSTAFLTQLRCSAKGFTHAMRADHRVVDIPWSEQGRCFFNISHLFGLELNITNTFWTMPTKVMTARHDSAACTKRGSSYAHNKGNMSQMDFSSRFITSTYLTYLVWIVPFRAPPDHNFWATVP